MNCKQGDLAMIVRSCAGNEGRVLKCLRLATARECKADSVVWSGPVWFTDADIPDTFGETTHLYPDNRLRPLRNSDGEDEILRLVGLPVGTPQVA